MWTPLKTYSIVRKFVTSNRTEILNSNTALNAPVMAYSERVKVDFGILFAEVLKEESAAETLKIIFDHLLVLSMVLILKAARPMSSRRGIKMPTHPIWKICSVPTLF